MKKETTKRILIAILIVTLFNFISPTISHGSLGGALFEPIAELLRKVADLVMEGLQEIFTGDGEIEVNDTYNIKYSPGIIFANKVPSMDVNFFKPGEEYTTKSSAKVLQPIVATWYKTLRAIALVGLLSVLVYIGIRILISTTGQEKAKYKKMIWDWLVAVCILFVLQYIMIFILDIVNRITEMLSINILGKNGEDTLISDLRNSIGDFEETFAEILIYLVLVIYTIKFTIQYLKRLLYMAFFTLISPLIALTYPIDKIKDGQSQAFSMWLKEYIFNALLQPMHLLLYYIFVYSATQLTKNWLYAIVAIGFMVPAEKFFRKMFGFDKAESSSQLGAAAGGAFAMNTFNKLKAAGGSKLSGGGKTEGEGSSSGANSTPRYISGPGGAVPNAVGVSSKTSNGASSSSSSTPRAASSSGSPRGANASGNARGARTSSSPRGANASGNARGARTSSSPRGANASGNARGVISSGNARRAKSSVGARNARIAKIARNAKGARSANVKNTNSKKLNLKDVRVSSVATTNGNSRNIDPNTPASNRREISFKNGARTLWGHYVNRGNLIKGAKGIGRIARKTIVGTAGVMALGTVGLAAGIATGDAGNAFKYGLAGAGAGFVGANALGDKATEFEKKNREIYKEGALGTDEYNARNSVKELTSDNDFNTLCRQMGITKQKDREQLIKQFYREGITSNKKIKKIMLARVKTGATQREIMAAYKINLEAQASGIKMKDIRERLITETNGNEEAVNRAIQLIDML